MCELFDLSSSSDRATVADIELLTSSTHHSREMLPNFIDELSPPFPIVFPEQDVMSKPDFSAWRLYPTIRGASWLEPKTIDGRSRHAFCARSTAQFRL